MHLNRLGSADELGINGPQVVIATINQTPLLGERAAEPGVHHDAGGLPVDALTNPASFNPVNANVAYIPRDTRWPYVQTWFASVQREIVEDRWVVELAYTGNHSLRAADHRDYNEALPNAPGGTLGVQPRRPNQSFGAITWVDPAGQSTYNGLSARVEHRFAAGLYFAELVHLVEGARQLGAGAGNITARRRNPQNIYNLATERGPSSFDMKLMNTYQRSSTSCRWAAKFGTNVDATGSSAAGR